MQGFDEVYLKIFKETMLSGASATHSLLPVRKASVGKGTPGYSVSPSNGISPLTRLL
ncbi:hypothetical protein [Nostoc sp.]|uniref:hypothetical protein n=1 Tax=Nostoc sp. TaxID=1180 RepID=UPI002FF76298